MLKPSLKHLSNIAVPYISTVWYELGYQLLPDGYISKLKEIQETTPSDPQKCCSKMMEYWLEVIPSASWYDLIQALKSPAVQLVSQSESIENKIKGIRIYIHICMYICIYNIFTND